jgi:sphingomyelin phosphodiesterase acid-like 3
MWKRLRRRLRTRYSLFFLIAAGICFSLFVVSTVACGSGEKPTDTVKEEESTAVNKTEPEPGKTGFSEGVPGQGNVAHISDIHFNPFYDATLMPRLLKYGADRWSMVFESSEVIGFGTWGKDETNYNLLKSSLEKMAAEYKNPNFIIFTGDFIAHEFHDRYKAANNGSLEGLEYFIKKTFTFIVLEFERYFPGAPVYFSLGNNDSYAGDYLIEPEGHFLKDTEPVFSVHWFQAKENKKSFGETYPIGGYFTVVPPDTKNTRVISLNTIFFSPNHETDFNAYDPGQKELDWFEGQLKTAKAQDEKIWLLLHIPPGANVYSSVRDGVYKSFWETPYNTRFLQLVTDYASVFTAAYAGHTHMDDFRLVIDSSKAPIESVMFVHICPAISPQFGNNPGFRHLVLDWDRFSVSNYNVFWLNLGAESSDWALEYNFNDTYHQAGANPGTLQAVYSAIKDDEIERTNYMNYYDVNHRQEMTPDNWKAYWCGIANLQQEDFDACVK